MSVYTKLSDTMRTSSEGNERDAFLHVEKEFAASGKPRYSWRGLEKPVLYLSNLSTLIILFIVFLQNLELRRGKATDLSNTVYSPASGVIEYEEIVFEGGFFTKANEFMGFPTRETDKAWEGLYNFGISYISKEEADRLPYPTLPILGTDKYLIELEAFHVLHCLNDIRKVFYPEVYGSAFFDLMNENGTLDRDNNFFRHFDHCIDAIRQSLMCHADVAPISFHLVQPPLDRTDVGRGIFPRLATRHTCRKFGKIRDWAKAHYVGAWSPFLSVEEARRVAEEAGFDQGSVEDDPVWASGP